MRFIKQEVFWYDDAGAMKTGVVVINIDAISYIKARGTRAIEIYMIGDDIPFFAAMTFEEFEEKTKRRSI